MKGVVRIAALLCSTLRLQRWIAVAGLASVALFQIGLIDAPRASSLAFAVGSLGTRIGLALLSVAIVLPLGMTLRAISAPRTLALIPYARTRNLLAVLLIVMALAAFVAGNVALLNAEIPSKVGVRIGPDILFIWALGAETLLMLYFFLLSSSKGITLLAVFLLVFVVGSHWSPPSDRVAASGMSEPRFLLLLTAGGWSAFALWYLSARSISPATWDVRSAGNRRSTWGHRLAAGMLRSKSESRVGLSRNSAMRVELLGLPSVAPIAMRSLGALFIFAILAGIATVRHPTGNPHGNIAGAYMFGLFFAFPIAVGLNAALIAWAGTRRARLLWLQSGCTRNELFRVCEQLAWRCFATVAVPVGALCIAVWIWLPHPTGNWAYLLVAALAPCACALYVGLMNVRGWRFLDAAAAVLTMTTAFLSIMAAPGFSYTTAVPWIVAAAEVLGAVVLRELAQRRWRRIDWLICKPQQLPSGFLRPVA